MDTLGRRLRALRKKHGLTLARLGQEVGLSASHLSQIERGAIMPSLPKLTAISQVLGVEVHCFFEEDTPLCVVRSSQGKALRESDQVLIELLSADPAGKSIFPYRVVCQPGASCEQPSTYHGEECAFVLAGQLTITLGDERIVLNAGDSIHYQRYQSRSWKNEGDRECVVIWAACPPIKEDELQG